MPFTPVEDLTRRGSILTEGDHQLVIELARGVVRENTLEWRAQSPESAAAWLLLLSHQNACLDEKPCPVESIPPAKNIPLLFRGQAAKYSSVLPSIYRTGRARDIEALAADWLHVAIQLWVEEGFKWVIQPYVTKLDSRDTTTIAQHYGIATLLTDWTWDPLNALAFAIQGEQATSEGTVLIRTVSKQEQDEVLLPPTFAYRVWKQRGAFQWFYCPPEDFNDRGVKQLGLSGFLNARAAVSTYPRISFPIDEESIDWASSRYRTLMTDDGPLGELTKWSLEAARHANNRPPNHLYYDPHRSEFEERLHELKIPSPSPFEQPAIPVLEDIAATVEYCDMMALRKRGDQWGYDLGALVVFCEALGGGNSVCRALEDSETAPHLKLIYRVANHPSTERALMRCRNPLGDFKQNVLQWYEDEWQGIDLFTPFESERES